MKLAPNPVPYDKSDAQSRPSLQPSWQPSSRPLSQQKLVALTLCALLPGACTEPADPGIALQDAYIKTAVPGRSMTAAYAKITNNEPETLCLTDFSATFASAIELHITESVGDPASGRVAMRHLPELCIEPGQTAELKPGGMHLMVMGLEDLPSPSTSADAEVPEVSLQLGTSKGQAFETSFQVRPFTE